MSHSLAGLLPPFSKRVFQTWVGHTRDFRALCGFSAFQKSWVCKMREPQGCQESSVTSSPPCPLVRRTVAESLLSLS